MGKFIVAIFVVLVLGSADSISVDRFRDTIVNNVEDRCIRSMIDKSISENMVNEISALIRDYYSISDTINLTIDQTNDLDASVNAIAKCYYIADAPSVYIHFNGNTMPHASQEYIMTTLYHEYLHAILFFNGVKIDQQHEPIATAYRKILAKTLLQNFPSLSMNEASCLVWEGLYETKAWKNLFEPHQITILNNNAAYKTGKKGSTCN